MKNNDLVPLGRVVCTRGVWQRQEADLSFASFIAASLSRHERKDWGDVCEEDSGLNDEAMTLGSRILSVYTHDDSTVIWIITEADRSATTVLFPHEY